MGQFLLYFFLPCFSRFITSVKISSRQKTRGKTNTQISLKRQTKKLPSSMPAINSGVEKGIERAKPIIIRRGNQYFRIVRMLKS